MYLLCKRDSGFIAKSATGQWRHFMFENHRIFKTQFAGRELSVETGKTCELSNGSCWVRYGETVVMANVTASAKPREGIDFLSLIHI